MLSGNHTRPIAVIATVIALGGVGYGVVTATSSGGSAAASTANAPRLGSGARSGQAAGGASGTVAGVSSSSFTLSTSAGQKVTVNQASSTTYQRGTSSTSASAIRTGEPVLALGTTSGTTITAAQVSVQPAGGVGSAMSSASGVIPFQRGAPTTSKQVGHIPADYRQGRGRSSAERRRITPTRPHWPPTQVGPSTVSSSWATASTRSTTSASTGLTTSS
jgi:hypothetical protein